MEMSSDLPVDCALSICDGSHLLVGRTYRPAIHHGQGVRCNGRRSENEHFSKMVKALRATGVEFEDSLRIGIGQVPMLQIDLASGRSMTPLPSIRVPRTGMLGSSHASPEGPAATFVNWLVREAPEPLRPGRDLSRHDVLCARRLAVRDTGKAFRVQRSNPRWSVSKSVVRHPLPSSGCLNLTLSLL